MQPAFASGFRLHHNGQILDGAEFPSARTILIDDPEYGFATVASSMEELLKGYHGARVEWPETATVPMALLLDLVNIAASLAAPVLGQLSTYLGYDIAERAAEQEAVRALARGETHL